VSFTQCQRQECPATFQDCEAVKQLGCSLHAAKLAVESAPYEICH
jgi:hypothetical protein